MSEQGRDPEARIIYLLIIVTTAPFIVASIVRDPTIGAGTTICMVVVALGSVGLVVDWRARVRVPHARARIHPRATHVREPRIDTVLVVEDEPAIRQFLRAALGDGGVRILEAATIADARAALRDATPTAIVLDLGLPEGDGLELLRQLRERDATPVVVLSARDRAEDRANAFDAGAADYVLKPVAARELRVRVHAAIARARHRAMPAERIVVGPFDIDVVRRTVRFESQTLTLSPLEFGVLAFLARNAGSVCTYEQLIRELWGTDSAHQHAEVRLLVAAVRRKIEADPARPRWLLTETGVGYRLRDVRPHLDRDAESRIR